MRRETKEIETVAPLVAVIGPTGSGKSEIGLRLAEKFPAEIINCDSLQIYRYFDIGTAKLPQAEWRSVPHHLIDVVGPDETFSAGDYARRARPLLAEIVARGRLPVVVGGTGFYLRALLEGLCQGPERDEALRERLARREKKRPGSLHRILTRLDSAAAARIHANDTRKLIRALEVRLLVRRPLSVLFSEGRDRLRGFRTLKIGLDPPRALLYERLDRRCAMMFEGGLLDEVRHILSLGVSADVKPFESHGYRQALQMLRGELTRAEALAQAQQNTRRYAKRQWTWFRHEPDVEWFCGFGDEETTQFAVIDRIRQFLLSTPRSPL